MHMGPSTSTTVPQSQHPGQPPPQPTSTGTQRALKVTCWRLGYGQVEREQESHQNMLTIRFWVVLPEKILVPICIINEPVMLHAGPLQVCGRLFYVARTLL